MNTIVNYGFWYCKNDILNICQSDSTWKKENCIYGCNSDQGICNSATNTTKNICQTNSLYFDVNKSYCENDMIKTCNSDGTWETKTCYWGCEPGKDSCNRDPPKRCLVGDTKKSVGTKYCYELKEIRTCKLDGTWDIVPCSNGCREDYHMCNPGSDSLFKCDLGSFSGNFAKIGFTSCYNKSKRTCKADGTWEIETCEYGCLKDDCLVKCKNKNYDYQVGARNCRDGKSIEICKDDGTWELVQVCKEGCLLGSTGCD